MVSEKSVEVEEVWSNFHWITEVGYNSFDKNKHKTFVYTRAQRSNLLYYCFIINIDMGPLRHVIIFKF